MMTIVTAMIAVAATTWGVGYLVYGLTHAAFRRRRRRRRRRSSRLVGSALGSPLKPQPTPKPVPPLAVIHDDKSNRVRSVAPVQGTIH